MYTFASLSRQNKNVVYLSLCLIKNHEKALTVEKCLPSHLWAAVAVAGVVVVVFSFGFEDGKIDIDGRMLCGVRVVVHKNSHHCVRNV